VFYKAINTTIFICKIPSHCDFWVQDCDMISTIHSSSVEDMM
jgi:hypothetical protein